MSRMKLSWMVGLSMIAVAAVATAQGADQAPAKANVSSIALPGAPADGVALDYLAIDRERHRVWVPAGGTGNTVVIDTNTQAVSTVDKFPTTEVERQGRKRVVGPSSATVGDGFVYVGNRADSSICAIDAASLERGECVKLPSSPDGVAYVAHKKEVWVTTPRDNSITILDVSKPSAPKLSGTIKLDGGPEGYAVDDGRGFFYTNLEDKDRTLRIDENKRKVTATWKPECGGRGPGGIAVEPNGQYVMVVCSGHVEVLEGAKHGKILSKLDTGDGVDNIDYLAARRDLYAAAGGAGKLTVAHLDEKGVLHAAASVDTAQRARNAVAASDGTAYVAVGPEGKILVVKPSTTAP
jgi:DNA-binding beta-propeller fold protein YncE